MGLEGDDRLPLFLCLLLLLFTFKANFLLVGFQDDAHFSSTLEASKDDPNFQTFDGGLRVHGALSLVWTIG